MIKNILQRIMCQIYRIKHLGIFHQGIHIAAIFQNRLFHLFIIMCKLQLFIWSFRIILCTEILKAKNKVVKPAIRRCIGKNSGNSSIMLNPVLFILTGKFLGGMILHLSAVQDSRSEAFSTNPCGSRQWKAPGQSVLQHRSSCRPLPGKSRSWHERHRIDPEGHHSKDRQKNDSFWPL